jgi:hypothetical protein
MADKARKAASAAKLHKDSMECNKPRKTPGHPVKAAKKRLFVLVSKV